MVSQNPYDSPKASHARRPSIVPSVTVFMLGLPLVTFGGQCLAAALYWLIMGEHDNAAMVVLMGSFGSISLAGGLKIWHFADMINPRKRPFGRNQE